MAEASTQAQTPSFRQVRSGNGVDWWSSAWKLLFNRGATAIWIVMWVIAFVILFVLHWIPVIGSFAGQIGWFVFMGGLMLASRKTEQSTPPGLGDLFSGTGAPLGSLIITAVLVLVAELVILGVLFVAGAGAVAGAFFGGMAGSAGVMAGLGATSLLLLLLGLVLLIPVGMAAWLAPALIVFRQQQPLEALKTSLAACWANLGPLTIYGLVWIGFAIVASIPFGLGWLVLAPLSILSTYAAYRDLFEPEQAAAT
jgi:uncharacterized membrane protein